tara:strand:- start:32 stop:295 length:264 start_codon:yes stop_codon:yes gene_type:complete
MITSPLPLAISQTTIITINKRRPIIIPINTDLRKDLSLINIGNNKFKGNINQERIPTKNPIHIIGELFMILYSINSVCSVSVTGKEA